MERKNIFAHTEPGNDYPAYISINRQEGGSFSVTVREEGGGGRRVASIELTADLAEGMASAMLCSAQPSSEVVELIEPMLMSFGQAVEALKAGGWVCRLGWNGKGMYLFLIGVAGSSDCWTYTNGRNDNRPLLPFIAMKTADDHVVPWLASQTDVLAEDWVIVAG